MWSMAWTVVASEVTRVCDWYATQVSAHAENDEPFRVLGALVVMLHVAECSKGDRLFDCDFFRCAVTNEKRLSTPLECDVLAFWDFSKFDFDLSQGKNISRCTHRSNKLMNESLCWVSWSDSGTWMKQGIESKKYEVNHRLTSNNQVGESLSLFSWLSPWCWTLCGVTSVSREIRGLDVSMSESDLGGIYNNKQINYNHLKQFHTSKFPTPVTTTTPIRHQCADFIKTRSFFTACTVGYIIFKITTENTRINNSLPLSFSS